MKLESSDNFRKFRSKSSGEESNLCNFSRDMIMFLLDQALNHSAIHPNESSTSFSPLYPHCSCLSLHACFGHTTAHINSTYQHTLMELKFPHKFIITGGHRTSFQSSIILHPSRNGRPAASEFHGTAPKCSETREQ